MSASFTNVAAPKSSESLSNQSEVVSLNPCVIAQKMCKQKDSRDSPRGCAYRIDLHCSRAVETPIRMKYKSRPCLISVIDCCMH